MSNKPNEREMGIAREAYGRAINGQRVIAQALADYRAELLPAAGDVEAAEIICKTAIEKARDKHSGAFIVSEVERVLIADVAAALRAARGNRAELEAAGQNLLIQRKNHAIILEKYDYDRDLIEAFNRLAAILEGVKE